MRIVGESALHFEDVHERLPNSASFSAVTAWSGCDAACSCGQRSPSSRVLGNAATLTASPWLPPSSTTWLAVSPSRKPTCPAEGSLPRLSTATAPKRPSSSAAPQRKYERAISERVEASPRRSMQAPTNAAHQAASNCGPRRLSGSSAENICAMAPEGQMSWPFDGSKCGRSCGPCTLSKPDTPSIITRRTSPIVSPTSAMRLRSDRHDRAQWPERLGAHPFGAGARLAGPASAEDQPHPPRLARIGRRRRQLVGPRPQRPMG